MMTNPQISILTAAYNAEKTIVQAINSVQTSPLTTLRPHPWPFSSVAKGINSGEGKCEGVCVPKNGDKSAEKVYRAILENPKSSNKDLCRLLGLSDLAVRNQIKLLKDDQVIGRSLKNEDPLHKFRLRYRVYR